MSTIDNRVCTFRIKYVIKDSYGIQYYTVLCNETEELHDFTLSQVKEKLHIYLQNCKIVDGNIITDAPELHVGKYIENPIKGVITGWNDLETWCRKNKRIDILKAYVAGDNRLPVTEVARRSGKQCKFKCLNTLSDGSICGHVWELSLSNVTANKGKASICPACRAREGSGKFAMLGINDFETWCKQNNRLDLLKEYNLAYNEQKASEIAAKLHSKVNWKCQTCGFEWYQSLNYRISNNSKCLKCQANRGKYTSLMQGANDLETWCKENGRNDILDAWDRTQKNLTL